MYNHNKGRRRKFRSNHKPFHRRNNGDGLRSQVSNSMLNEQIRANPFRGNHNIQKLIEKYNSLAKEALSIGDKILSENYFQHAEHFSRIAEANSVNQNKNNDLNSVKDSNSEKKTVINNDDNIQPDKDSNNTSK